MIIILEGVNGSGKSTLAKYLSEKLNFPVMHPGPKPATNEIAISQCVEQILQPDNVIMDRSTVISRPVYGDDNECVEGLGIEHLKSLSNFLGYMVASPYFVFVHTIGRGEHQLKDYYTDHHIQSITDKHEDLRTRYKAIFSKIPHLEYDFEIHTCEEVLNWVCSRMIGGAHGC